jgi:hypothetical protein
MSLRKEKSKSPHVKPTCGAPKIVQDFMTGPPAPSRRSDGGSREASHIVESVSQNDRFERLAAFAPTEQI